MAATRCHYWWFLSPFTETPFTETSPLDKDHPFLTETPPPTDRDPHLTEILPPDKDPTEGTGNLAVRQEVTSYKGLVPVPV